MAEKKEKQYVSDNAQLMAEWDWEENNRINLFPDKVTHGSTKTANWLCKNGHRFSARIDHRTIMGSNCPYCTGKRPILGVNDLATTYPELLQEWDYEKNMLTPEHYLAGSNKKVYWVCKSCGHHWSAQIISRTMKNAGCPVCMRIQRGRKKTENTLINSGSLQQNFPDLAAEWDYEKNASITPENVHANSRNNVWWLGKCGHSWQSTIQNRVAGNGCPICAGKTVLFGFNDLATQFPEIADEWAFDLNGELSPRQITAHNDQKVWWRCSQCHEAYLSSVYSRTSLHTGCPVCANRKIVVGKNDLATTHLDIAAEWNYVRNGDLKPQNVVAGSNRRVWWVCEKGHEWQATVSDRKSGRGCPLCRGERSTSYPEQILFYYLAKKTKAINRYRLLGRELDIFLPDLNIGIEYNGLYYHRNRVEQDAAKRNFFHEQGIRVIVVHEGQKELVDGDDIYYLYENQDYLNLDKAINAVFSLCSLPPCDINIKRDRAEIYEQFALQEKAHSFAEKYPWLIDEWDQEKNGKLTPWHISYGSSKKIHWKCIKCGHQWEAVASSRRINGCPACARKRRKSFTIER